MWDKLQHEMYWNFSIDFINIFFDFDKLQHEMYWNIPHQFKKSLNSLINYNMRCIETETNTLSENPFIDKLQHEMYWNVFKNCFIKDSDLINYNMRCIETKVFY